MKEGKRPTFFALFGKKKKKCNKRKKNRYPATSDRTAESLNVDIRLPLASFLLRAHKWNMAAS